MSEQSGNGNDLSTRDLANAGEGGQPAGGRQDEPSGQREPSGEYGQQQGSPSRDQSGGSEGDPQRGGDDGFQGSGERQAEGSPGQFQQQSAPGQQFGGSQGQEGGGSGGATGGLVQDNQGFRDRWTGIQAAFVDEPRKAVEQADGLVAEVIQHLARSFAEERSSLERQWAGGNSVSTEDLRVSLQRYRQFFQALLRD